MEGALWIIACQAFIAACAFVGLTDAKLITGLAPCPTGAPPARECLVSVLVDVRAFKARARERNVTLPRVDLDKLPSPPTPLPPSPSSQNGVDQTLVKPLPPSEPGPGYNLVAETDLAVNDPFPPPPSPGPASRPVDVDLKKQYEDHEEELRMQFLREQQDQQRKQFQLEQAVRFQEDELQQLRDQVQELRLQLTQALQLYQLTRPQPQQQGPAAYRSAFKGPAPAPARPPYSPPPPPPPQDQVDQERGPLLRLSELQAGDLQGYQQQRHAATKPQYPYFEQGLLGPSNIQALHDELAQQQQQQLHHNFQQAPEPEFGSRLQPGTPGGLRRFYRNSPPSHVRPIYKGYLREVARGEPVVAT